MSICTEMPEQFEAWIGESITFACAHKLPCRWEDDIKKQEKDIQSQEMQPSHTEMLYVSMYPMLITSDPIVQITSSSF